MTAQPDISILMPTYRSAATLDRAISSCLASTGVSVEVCVVDDASPDNTWDTLCALAAAEPRLRIARLPHNEGPSAARNAALDIARGRIIAIVDADDAIVPDRLSVMMRALEASGADIVFDSLIDTDPSGRRLGDRPFLRDMRFRSETALTLDDWIAFNMPMGRADVIGYLKPLIDRRALDRTGLRYDPALRNSEDYDLIARLLAEGCRACFIPHEGYLYARAEGSVSHRLSPAETAAWLASHERFASAYAPTLPRSSQSLLHARGKRLADIDLFVRVVDRLKARDPGSAARLLAKRPLSAPDCLARLSGIALSKLIAWPTRR